MNKKSISNIKNVIRRWMSTPDFSRCFQYTHTKQASSGVYFPFPEELSPGLVFQLKKSGITQLYGHQLDSYLSIKQRNHVIITTGTASGKSLCYSLPVLDHLLKVPSARALLLFPTKALTHDQHKKISYLTDFEDQKTENSSYPAVYDGDTPVHKRQAIRQNSRCLLTNPDMLHTGILPHHTLWGEFFNGLEYIIIDEIHAYRGVFGSHVSNVIRRLKRIAKFYGSNPIFILTSATIANPSEHGIALIGEKLLCINQDDAPHGEKTTILYNPPVIHKETGIRKSASSEVIKLSNDLLNEAIQVLIFARSRRGVEMILRQLRISRNDDPSLYHSYRSGYLATDRRRIETDLRNGKLRAVAATNALELGVDIGGIDAVFLTGYPGSIAAMHQQAGRAGRKNAPSLAVLVATGSPIDQYLMRHPDYIIGKSPESALIDPNHPLILLGHLRCAAFEIPFTRGENFGTLDPLMLEDYLNFLTDSNVLLKSGEKYVWTDAAYPASEISLRSSDSKTIALRMNEAQSQRTIGEIDYSSALWMVHPGAIYLHEGESFLVDELNLTMSEAILSKKDEDYFTDPMRKIALAKITEIETQEQPGGQIHFGEIQVTTEILGFKKVLWTTREVLSVEPLNLPSTTIRTTAYWLALSDEMIASLQDSQLWNSQINDYGKNWNQIRIAVRQRDNFQCKVCGQKESGKAHHVHHKAPLKSFQILSEANHLENLITLCPRCHKLAEYNVKIRSGLAGLGYALAQIAPLFLMCDTTDINTHTDPSCSIANGKPAIILYDQINAGIGLSKKCFDLHPVIMHNLDDLVRHCACFDGCPSCVGPGGENGVGGKLETLALLEQLTKRID